MCSLTPATPGAQAADAADDHVDVDTPSCDALIQRAHDRRVGDRVALDDDRAPADPARACDASRSISVEEAAAQVDRRHQQLLVGVALSNSPVR